MTPSIPYLATWKWWAVTKSGNQAKERMYGKSAHKAYHQVQVTTTDRGRLLLLMYEGAVKFLRQAKAGLDAKDLAKFCRYISKAQAIIVELVNTLDFEKGGIIATDLDRLYDFILFYLTEANLYRDGERVERVIGLIEKVYEGYKDIIESGLAERQLAAQTPGARVDAGDGSGEARGIQISL